MKGSDSEAGAGARGVLGAVGVTSGRRCAGRQAEFERAARWLRSGLGKFFMQPRFWEVLGPGARESRFAR